MVTLKLEELSKDGITNKSPWNIHILQIIYHGVLIKYYGSLRVISHDTFYKSQQFSLVWGLLSGKRANVPGLVTPLDFLVVYSGLSSFYLILFRLKLV